MKKIVKIFSSDDLQEIQYLQRKKMMLLGQDHGRLEHKSGFHEEKLTLT